MKKIEDIIKLKYIELENVKVKFTVKLLQYELNAVIYKYKQKYAFNEYITQFIDELTNKVTQSQPYKEKDKEVEELLTRTRDIIIQLRNHNETPSKQEFDYAIDSALRYILFTFSKKKQEMGLYEEIELLNELKTIKSIIVSNKLTETDRVKNSYKLMEQLQNNIINIIKE